MGNPEYTEKRLNHAISKLDYSLLRANNLYVSWEGDPHTDEDTFFVMFAGDDTPFVVVDLGDIMEIREEVSPNHFCVLNYATTYVQVAKQLADIITEAAANGTIYVEEQA